MMAWIQQLLIDEEGIMHGLGFALDDGFSHMLNFGSRTSYPQLYY